ncbi:hypothetical protein GCM10010345_40130 [Streptomyces canarius]|uniref:Secreted protein n=1 Tax=Streptomyces canarius TaxID=285453 RepID=A0ABQ3CRP7_9ACTN|nr:hypothetical protein GCM10010345_40130 [Streptomyces canarius]
MVQLAAWAGVAVNASASGATSPVTPSATTPRLRMTPMAAFPLPLVPDSFARASPVLSSAIPAMSDY